MRIQTAILSPIARTAVVPSEYVPVRVENWNEDPVVFVDDIPHCIRVAGELVEGMLNVSWS